MKKTLKPSATVDDTLGKHFDNITIVIKTFERESCLRMSLDSLRIYYPFLPVIIIDDSKVSLDPDSFDEFTQYVYTEYDIGISEGRNRAVNRVKTEFTFIMDDDFIFTPMSRLDLLLHAVSVAGFAIAGSRMINFGRNEQIFHGALEPIDSDLLFFREKKTGTHNGYPTYDICHNIFLARTQFLKDNPWDPKLKLREHWDFFYRIKIRNSGKVTMRPDVSFDHYPHRPSVYRLSRFASTTKYVKLALTKHGFKKFKNIISVRQNIDLISQRGTKPKSKKPFQRLRKKLKRLRRKA